MPTIQPYVNSIEIKNIILCGDFNARLAEYGLTLQNVDLAYGVPTLLTGSATNNNVKSSVIDFFLTTNDELTIAPNIQIESLLSLGSDHKLLYFGFTHDFSPPTPTHLHPRKLWKINKFKSTKDARHVPFIEKYRLAFTSLLTDYTPKLNPDNFTNLTHDDRQIYLDQIHSELIQIICTSLDTSVGSKEQRNKNWK
ncbi:hypothetical protein BD770DRAFT_449509 [Pilaira anomala]|nr:hypothetical protein BD770DRAFT_449509 [Pilaira anomala]